MITHYGLFWSEPDVFWGKRGGTRGQLLGREKLLLDRRGAPTKRELRNAKDYRDYIGVYCLYGDGELVYIGEAGLGTEKKLFDRIKSHRTGPMAGRWDQFSWFGRNNSDGECSVKEAFAQLEAVAIAAINPGFNKQSGTFSGAKQVYQIPHDKSEGGIDTKINRLTDVIMSLQGKLLEK